MPDSVQTLATTTIGISAVLPTTQDNNVTTGYPSLTMVVIAEIIDIPEFGKTFNLVTHSPIATRQIQKLKGSFNNGSATLSMARDDDDAGQVIALAALEADADYAFEVTYQDGSIDWFQAKVMSFTSIGGGVDSIVNRSMQLEVTVDVVSEPAP